ncbi:hypothetical protein [Amycolatopsis australiensis]|uniref:Uncharacterized protein n=1 Tax=Amycolatopsis australiensis TaxID=546364 RepID=A0A1K1LKW3_9PSEU|nr:hypothetical protein [Amycolatopsis australiensis]SFW11541.1 hypothetical protein SAMN04489730_0030 [Amycolatopsis australiensis]
MPDEAEYTQRAEERIREVLNVEHAVVPLELEARISEAGYADSGININPHHISNALRNLVARGEVLRTGPVASRGGHQIETIQPADQRRRKTAITHAAARKRLLYGRYLGWAQGTERYRHGLIGPAGEAAVRGGLLMSGGIQPFRPDAGEVTRLLGTDLPGPLDSAGIHVPLLVGELGEPIVVMIEIKNIRGWMYPSSEEVYQLLDKACVLQTAHPDQPILPVFVCRKAQDPLFWMAQQLGFMVIDLGIQFAGDVEQASLDEIRNELAFSDLRVGAGPSVRVRDRFQKTVPKHGTRWAADWRKTVANHHLVHYIHELRYAKGYERNVLMQEFRQFVKDAGYRGF